MGTGRIDWDMEKMIGYDRGGFILDSQIISEDNKKQGGEEVLESAELDEDASTSKKGKIIKLVDDNEEDDDNDDGDDEDGDDDDEDRDDDEEDGDKDDEDEDKGGEDENDEELEG